MEAAPYYTKQQTADLMSSGN